MSELGGFKKRDNPVTDLNEKIDELTKPQKHRFTQTSENGAVKMVRTASPLLTQLRNLIANSVGAGGGAGKAAHERTPFDVSAFTLYETIDGRIRSWCLDAHIPVRDELEDSLRAWFVVWTQKTLEDVLVERHTDILRGWVVAIEDLLEPPTKQELTQACPVCGQMWATVGRGEDQESVRALWAVWRVDPNNSYGVCRSCDKVWSGVSQMRQLRIDLDAASEALISA